MPDNLSSSSMLTQTQILRCVCNKNKHFAQPIFNNRAHTAPKRRLVYFHTVFVSRKSSKSIDDGTDTMDTKGKQTDNANILPYECMSAGTAFRDASKSGNRKTGTTNNRSHKKKRREDGKRPKRKWNNAKTELCTHSFIFFFFFSFENSRKTFYILVVTIDNGIAAKQSANTRYAHHKFIYCARKLGKKKIETIFEFSFPFNDGFKAQFTVTDENKSIINWIEVTEKVYK